MTAIAFEVGWKPRTVALAACWFALALSCVLAFFDFGSYIDGPFLGLLPEPGLLVTMHAWVGAGFAVRWAKRRVDDVWDRRGALAVGVAACVVLVGSGGMQQLFAASWSSRCG